MHILNTHEPRYFERTVTQQMHCVAKASDGYLPDTTLVKSRLRLANERWDH